MNYRKVFKCVSFCDIMLRMRYFVDFTLVKVSQDRIISCLITVLSFEFHRKTQPLLIISCVKTQLYFSVIQVGLGGLGVTCSPRDSRFAGSSTRWADYFNELVGPHWSKVARDRNEWEVLGNQLNAVNHSRGLLRYF